MASFSSRQATIEIQISTLAMSTLTVSITVNPTRPRWVTLVSIFFKNLILLIVILGLVQMIRKLALKSTDSSERSLVVIPDFERQIAEVESFVKITMSMMQVVVEFVNKKIESEVGGMRRDLSDKIEEKENAGKVNHRFEKLSEMLDKKLGAVEFLRKEDLDKIFDDLMNVKGADNGDKEVSLDGIMMVARDMLVKEIQRHAGYGLDRVDYSLSSGGAKVVRHSDLQCVGLGRMQN